jgi:hypothetical protein
MNPVGVMGKDSFPEEGALYGRKFKLRKGE